MPRAGIIGIGNIGSELYNKLKAKEWDIGCIIDTGGVYEDILKEKRLDDCGNYRRHIKELDIMFLAIPTFDDGKII